MWIVPEEDLEYIFSKTKNIWKNFKGSTVLITGGTGWFGKWLIEAFLYANKQGADVKLLILSRDPDIFLQSFPKFSNSEFEIKFIKGDIKTYSFKEISGVDFIIHAATEASAKLNSENPLEMLDSIILGTKNILAFASNQDIKGFLFISSGAVYGNDNPKAVLRGEDDLVQMNLNDRRSAYAEGKRMAELYCSIYNHHQRIPIKIARCFAFVGPHIPLNSHFAIGNFIDNILKNSPLLINSDGSAIRSYMYMSDLVISLLKILIEGEINKPYNVGSEEYYSIKEIAEIIVSEYSGSINIKNKAGSQNNIYVPNISLLKNDLGLHDPIPFRISLQKTINFCIKHS